MNNLINKYSFFKKSGNQCTNKYNYSVFSKIAGGHGLPKRCIFAVLAFLGMASLHSMRVNLSVTILAMVNNSVEQSRNGSSSTIECPELVENVTLSNKLTAIQVMSLFHDL